MPQLWHYTTFCLFHESLESNQPRSLCGPHSTFSVFFMNHQKATSLCPCWRLTSHSGSPLCVSVPLLCPWSLLLADKNVTSQTCTPNMLMYHIENRSVPQIQLGQRLGKDVNNTIQQVLFMITQLFTLV